MMAVRLEPTAPRSRVKMLVRIANRADPDQTASEAVLSGSAVLV